MREYRFKRGFKPTQERLEEMVARYFGEFEREGDVCIVKYKAIEEMRLWLDGKILKVESRTNPNVDDRTALETLKTYNRFLDELTGYTAKERKKHMMKDVESES